MKNTPKIMNILKIYFYRYIYTKKKSMREVKRITESEIKKLSNKIIRESEIEEGIFDSISNAFQGVKGFWRGEGYDFFKYLSSLKNMARDLKKLDKPNDKIMTKLKDLKVKITSSTMPQEKKGQLVFEIDKALENFDEYTSHISKLEDVATQRLKGITTYTEKPKHGLDVPSQEKDNSNLPVIPKLPSSEPEIVDKNKPVPTVSEAYRRIRRKF